MTTKKTWRLKEPPSVESLRELVKDKILSVQEAREILFTEETNEDRDKKSLEEEIKFLRALVEKLSNNRTTIIETIREVQKPWVPQPWFQPYAVWCNVGNSAGGGGGYSIVSGTATTANAIVVATNSPQFSTIKTF